MRFEQTALAGAIVALAACADAPTSPRALQPTAAAPAAARAAENFPDVIALPLGFAPEGIASGRGTTFYAGSRTTGAVYQGDFRTGTGAVLVPAQAGRIALGLKYDQRTDRLFVAGGMTGQAYVYDASTGATLATYQLAPAGSSFINDVVLTKDAAYFTNSSAPVLYRVPLGPGGALPAAGFETIPLTGDFVFVPGAINANGIDATANGKTLVIVNSATGTLYRVDPATGVTTAIDLGGDDVRFGDGILFVGQTLYVVQNQLNRIAVIDLDPKLQRGTIEGYITDTDFDVPTTIATFGNALYAVNARFEVPPGPTVPYQVVRVPR